MQKQKFEFDILEMYYDKDYYVDNLIKIRQPKIKEIIDYGEFEFYNLINMLCGNTTSMRLILWENGINWNKISDFELFCMIAPNFKKEETEILLGDFDLSKLHITEKENGKNILIYLDNPEIQIDEDVYYEFVNYLRLMFNINPKVEKATNKSTAELMIFDDQMEIEKQKRLSKNAMYKKSVLFPLISSAVNHPGFKYNKYEVLDLNIFEFYDSIKRLQIFENSTSFMKGIYSGMIDASKIANLENELNWTRDIYI